MNKKKKTLLIALSIIIMALTTFYIIPKNDKKIEVKKEKVVEVKKPEEEEKEKEEIIQVNSIVLLSITEIAKEVIEGKWGDGEERKTKLTEAGYNYEEVQAEVDKLTPKPKVEIKQTIYTPSSLPTGEYPEARLIWNTMRSWGWSPETCAGIIGNMMAEIGGGTLNLSNWSSNDGCGYGLIQWTGGRAALIKSRYGAYPNIEQQLIFMKDELLGTNGVKPQINGSILSTILNTDNTQTPESIALAFATYYERCGASYRARRQGFARIAYQYFMQ